MPNEAGAYQLLDGHHRRAALERLGAEAARCCVWDVDDAQAMALLATLNRLEGADDPHRRAALVEALRQATGERAATMAKTLPESVAQVSKLLALQACAPRPRPPKPLDEMPAAVTFFLTGAQRGALDAALRRLGGQREAALMRLVTVCSAALTGEPQHSD